MAKKVKEMSREEFYSMFMERFDELKADLKSLRDRVDIIEENTNGKFEGKVEDCYLEDS